MQEHGDVKVDLDQLDLDLEYYDLWKGSFLFEYDYGKFESKTADPPEPDSTSHEDVKLEELSSLNCLGTFHTPAPPSKEVEPGNAEPCAAALAIEANIPAPNQKTLSKWRTFISSAYYHPNILAHSDVLCLKELFQLFGSDIEFESVNVMIDIGETSREYKPSFHLRPPLPTGQSAPIFTFAHVKDFLIENELKVCIVKKYSIMDSMKRAISEMVNFIIEYPEALYLETYGFVLDFLLKFGVRSDVIIDAVMRTQRRRRKSQLPASVLVLKQASRLGKGRKEFLQKRLLSSPEKKYDPVVPIVSEPTPIRQLRNRKTGNGIDCTPDEYSDKFPRFNFVNESSQPISSTFERKNATSGKINPRITRVKKKLFTTPGPKDNSNPILVAENTVSSPAPNSHNKNVATERFEFESKGYKVKRFYKRRDKNLIDKPFICTLCPDKSFAYAYKGNLVLHMKQKHPAIPAGKMPEGKWIHSKISPYTCPVCLRGYSSVYRCKTHIHHFHPEHKDWQPLSNFSDKKAPTTPLKKSRRIRGLPGDIGDDPNILKMNEVDGAACEKSEMNVETPPSQLLSNSSAGFCVHPFDSDQELKVQVNKSFDSVFDGLQFDTLNHVTTTTRHLRTAVM